MGPFIFLFFYSVLAQVKDFLPRLAEANQILKEKVENGEGDAIDIETIGDSVESVIQMVSCDNHMLLNSFLNSGDFCCLLITFANSLDPDQDRQNVGPDLDPICLPH